MLQYQDEILILKSHDGQPITAQHLEGRILPDVHRPVVSDPNGPLDLTGDHGRNNMEGGIANDTLIGLGGHDTLSGLGGDDVLDGGSGSDYLYGGAGGDFIDGGDGHDILIIDRNRNDVDVVRLPGGIAILDRGEFDRLENIEMIHFNDLHYSYATLEQQAVDLNDVIGADGNDIRMTGNGANQIVGDQIDYLL